MIEVNNYRILFQTGTYRGEAWDTELGTYQGDVIPNAEVALNVAQKVFDGIGKNPDYVPVMLFFDKDNEVWIITFNQPYAENSKTVRVGGDCSIAIQKSDGKVLRIWYGE